jgi:hypothetical protein
VSIQERSYSGKVMRPTPEIHVEQDGSFGAIVTPWGARSSVKKVIDTLSDFIMSAKNDMESTSPFQVLTCLSPMANTLRSSIMLANDVVYREENKNEYQTGVELFVFSRNATEFSFVQIGHPHLILVRKGNPLTLLSPKIDMALEFSSMNRPLAPLPHELLGLHSTSNFSVISFRPQPGDELILVSRTRIPTSLLLAASEEQNLDGLSRILASDDPNEPFWLGHFPISSWKSASEDAA